MAKQKRTIGELIGRLIETKQDKVNKIGALLGKYDDQGNTIVDVENRNGYSYVRLNGNISEIVEAFNPSSLSQFDLKVLVIRSDDGNYYEIEGRDVSQYTQWERSSLIAGHGYQHQFGTGDNEGADPVFIYKRQLLQPLGVHPNSTGSSFTVSVEPDFYIWNNNINYFPGAESIDLTPARPTDQGGRFVTIYLDGNTQNIAYQTGNLFYNQFYSTGTLDNIPEVSLLQGIPLAAIYLVSGTTSIEWDNIFDIRNFLNAGGTSVNLHDLDPQYNYHTGTIRSSVSTIVDSGGYYTGTVVEDVLQEVGYRWRHREPRLITSNATGTITDDVVLCNASGTNITYSLLSANNMDKYTITVKKIDLSNSNVILLPFGSEKLDTYNSGVLNTANQFVDLYSYSGNWYTV